jgi:preprotein translocase subunit YajC
MYGARYFVPGELHMKAKGLFILALGLALGSGSAMAQDAPAGAQSQGPENGGGRRGGYGGGMGMMGRGVMGTVTEVAPDHFTVKNEAGEIYTIHFSANTRIVKQPPQRQGQGGQGEGGQRTPPEAIKATDIKVGDAIGAMGEIDATAKTVGALMIMQIDPERAKQMREMQANFGKTWIMGKVTAIKDTQVTLQSQVDNAAHSFVADENTTFRKRRDPITLGDVAVGDSVRVEGAVKAGLFVATTVSVMGPPTMGGPQPRRNEQPQ